MKRIKRAEIPSPSRAELCSWLKNPHPEDALSNGRKPSFSSFSWHGLSSRPWADSSKQTPGTPWRGFWGLAQQQRGKTWAGAKGKVGKAPHGTHGAVGAAVSCFTANTRFGAAISAHLWAAAETDPKP